MKYEKVLHYVQYPLNELKNQKYFVALQILLKDFLKEVKYYHYYNYLLIILNNQYNKNIKKK